MENSFNRGAHEFEIHTAKHRFHGARMYLTNATNHTSSGNFQGVPFNNEDYDTSPASDLVDLANDSFDITVTAYYRITAQVRFANNATGRRQVRIVSANDGTLSIAEFGAIDANVDPSPRATWTGPLDAGDVITVEASQNSGGNLAYEVTAPETWAEIELVGV